VNADSRVSLCPRGRRGRAVTEEEWDWGMGLGVPDVPDVWNMWEMSVGNGGEGGKVGSDSIEVWVRVELEGRGIRGVEWKGLVELARVV
jgi:hypothetical protein